MDTLASLLSLFPVLKTLDEQALEELMREGSLVKRPAGAILMRQGETCPHVPLVLSGVLRVYKLSPGGREMTLYRAVAGDTCLVSVACKLTGEDFPAIAQVEEDAELFFIPTGMFQKHLDRHLPWKDFVILTLYKRLAESLQVLESVTFDRVDRRLAAWLLNLSEEEKSATLHVTHEQIAAELGSAREVISRMLGEMRHQGWLELGRKRIKIIDKEALAELAE
ncbi:MAG: Crp/Fnr family transcriptional regulator [Bacillota bacterium]